jgi:hypothetical protein
LVANYVRAAELLERFADIDDGEYLDTKEVRALADALRKEAERVGHRALGGGREYEDDETTGLAGHPDGPGERW